MNLLLVLGMMLPVASSAVVMKPVANMYSHATTDTDVVSQAIYGTTVDIVEEQGDWAKVRTPDAYTGWMPLASLRVLGSGGKPYASAGTVARVESLFANLYREADVTRQAPLLELPFGARLEVAAQPETDERRWIEVRLPDTGTAWVQRGDVTFDSKPLSIGQTIELAKRFLGLTYLWGGTSTYGFDCSGFTQMLVAQRGVVMPRDADLQAGWDGVVVVKRNKLKPGDLLFFGSSAQKITHTGMYIGHGKFIHDTTHGHPGIQISHLSAEPWKTLLVACRRLK
jgi:cell wall-associated NlpC family hydrolase